MNKTWKIILIISLIINLSIIYVGYKALNYRRYINYWLEKYTQVVAEFSARNVYEHQNQTLKSNTVIENRIVFLGTQVTDQWDLEKYFENYEVIDRSIPGQRVAGFLLRFVPDVIELKPKAVVIEISSYNFRPQWTLKEIKDYVSSLAVLAKANGIEPIIGTIIPPGEDFELNDNYKIMDSLKVFNQWLVVNASGDKWRVADFNKVLRDEHGYLNEAFSVDIIDPNETGYRLMAEAVLVALESD